MAKGGYFCFHSCFLCILSLSYNNTYIIWQIHQIDVVWECGWMDNTLPLFMGIDGEIVKLKKKNLCKMDKNRVISSYFKERKRLPYHLKKMSNSNSKTGRTKSHRAHSAHSRNIWQRGVCDS